jgi:hypothetical protein
MSQSEKKLSVTRKDFLKGLFCGGIGLAGGSTVAAASSKSVTTEQPRQFSMIRPAQGIVPRQSSDSC